MDFIDRSLTRCSGLMVMVFSNENSICRSLRRCNDWFDWLLPRCSKWFDRITSVCDLSLPKCNEWITLILDDFVKLMLPKCNNVLPKCSEWIFTMIADIVDLSSLTPWFRKGSLLTWIYHLVHESVVIKWCYLGLLVDATFFQFFAFLRSVLPIIPLVPIHVLSGP